MTEDALRRRLLRPLAFQAYLFRRLPLAAMAGLRLERFDDEACTVSLPGGFRTRNPFGSTYFAAQAMAAEMSTGAPALVVAQAAPGSVALIVREVKGVFVKRIEGRAFFTFADIGEMRKVAHAAGPEGAIFVARSQGVTAEGAVASEFEITWSFRRRI
jgi:hypothetical protein